MLFTGLCITPPKLSTVMSLYDMTGACCSFHQRKGTLDPRQVASSSQNCHKESNKSHTLTFSPHGLARRRTCKVDTKDPMRQWCLLLHFHKKMTNYLKPKANMNIADLPENIQCVVEDGSFCS